MAKTFPGTAAAGQRTTLLRTTELGQWNGKGGRLLGGSWRRLRTC